MAWAMENRDTICKGFTSHAEKFAILRKVMFPDVDDWEDTGEAQIPQNNGDPTESE